MEIITILANLYLRISSNYPLMNKVTNLLIGLVLILMPSVLEAQVSKTFPKNLRLLTNQELMSLGNDGMKGDIPTYDLDGQLIDEENPISEEKRAEYISEYFTDESGKLVAIKFRKQTDQEAAFIKQFYEQQAKLAALIGTPAKDFETVDMQGNSVKLGDLKGSIVAINFWFIGCKPCIMEMPELNELVAHFEDKGVKFLAIATDSKEKLVEFAKKRDFDYNVVPDGKSLTKLYEITGYPTHCIIDQEGNITYFKSAYSPQTASELTAAITYLLDK